MPHMMSITPIMKAIVTKVDENHRQNLVHTPWGLHDLELPKSWIITLHTTSDPHCEPTELLGHTLTIPIPVAEKVDPDIANHWALVEKMLKVVEIQKKHPHWHAAPHITQPHLYDIESIRGDLLYAGSGGCDLPLWEDPWQAYIDADRWWDTYIDCPEGYRGYKDENGKWQVYPLKKLKAKWSLGESLLDQQPISVDNPRPIDLTNP
jgi:hypothetical protein